MRRLPLFAAAAGLALVASAPAAAASAPTGAAAPATAPAAAASARTSDAAPAPAHSFLGGRASLAFRLRYEGVEDAAYPHDASAATLRTRLGWQSGPLAGVAFALEIDDVRVLVDHYDSTHGADRTHPVVGDPEATEVNVATAAYVHGASAATVGRQRIAFDNQRFVGTVGWRQNEQTYDAIALRTKALPRTDLAYVYVENVNRVFGPRDGGTTPANWHGGTHLLNAKLNAGAAGSVSLFAYLMEFDNAEAQSNATYGVLWAGAVPLAPDWKLPFALSYATQADWGDNPVAYSADYSQAEAGVAYRDVSVKLGRETLGGDPARAGRAFRTPLATLHAFQGWDDKFLTTPPQGIEDTYVAVAGKAAGVDLQASWHDYGAEAVSRDYGTEFDVSVGRRFAGRYDVLAKYADYRADGFGRDTRKYWLQFAASF